MLPPTQPDNHPTTPTTCTPQHLDVAPASPESPPQTRLHPASIPPSAMFPRAAWRRWASRHAQTGAHRTGAVTPRRAASLVPCHPLVSIGDGLGWALSLILFKLPDHHFQAPNRSKRGKSAGFILSRKGGSCRLGRHRRYQQRTWAYRHHTNKRNRRKKKKKGLERPVSSST